MSVTVAKAGLFVPLVAGVDASHGDPHVSVRFSPDGYISSTGGCNYYLGSNWSIDGNVLRVSGTPSKTLIGCDEQLNAQDDWFDGFLRSSPEVRFDDSFVIFTSGDTIISMVDGRWP